MLFKTVDNWADEADIWSLEMRVWCVQGTGSVVERDVITLCYRGREARVSELGPSVNTGVISHGLIIGEHEQ